MAVYAHLQLDSIRVQPGRVVLMGEQIARSGNTGFSSGPHLHFAVQRNAYNEMLACTWKPCHLCSWAREPAVSGRFPANC
jgi:murein DD-endopeptidase MepM/ murein hydrolase activator NlpD